MNYMIIRDNTIINVIVWDGVSDYFVEEGEQLLPWDEDQKPWIGWTLVDNTWIAPEPIAQPINDNKASAIEKLSALGLTEAEINALIGR